MPMRKVFDVCARAASGLAAAAPSSVMNSRRLMKNMGLPPLRVGAAKNHHGGRQPPVYCTLGLPSAGGQVLGLDPKCCELRRRAAGPAQISDSTHLPRQEDHCTAGFRSGRCLLWVINGPWVVQQRLSLLPRERTSSVSRITSEKCHKQTLHDLLNHLVSAQQHRSRHSKTERLGRLGVYSHLEFHRHLNGQVSRLGAAQYLIDIDSAATNYILEVGSV